MLAFAGIGLAGCMVFSIVSGLLPIGQAGTVSLPEDFFRSPLIVLALLSGLVFLCSPGLGMLWAAYRTMAQ